MKHIDHNIWIIGCGDIGRRVAALYQKQDIHASALVNSESSADQCRAMGLTTFQMNLDSPTTEVWQDDLDKMEDICLYYLVPPPNTGRTDPRLRALLDNIGSRAKKVVLISTTGVYGDCLGQWIDESHALNPGADRSYRRLDAEAALQEWSAQTGGETVILRVSGIYAKERLPLQRISQGTPMVEPTASPWTNRIHADDLAMVCIRAMEKAEPGSIYNVSDGHPSKMTDYFDQVADYSGLPRQPHISYEQALQQLSPGMISYLKESRRLKNTKMMQELEIEKLSYPDLSVALQKFSEAHGSPRKNP